MDLFDAEILAKELISRTVPHYQFAWHNRKNTNGNCDYQRRVIYLSRHLTRIRSTEAVTLTIMHEIAHALTPGDGHGKRWKAQMRAFGLPADRCSQDRPDRSSISNWHATCPGCGKVSYMVRKPRVDRSCGQCSRTYNPKYALNFVRMT